MSQLSYLIAFNALYIILAGAYFVRDLNFEFIIYVAVIVAIMIGVFGTLHVTRFPAWQLWLFSIWGLLHVLGGAVKTIDGVLFAYHIYPFLDLGGEFYILKYDQIVHMYLYGVVAAMAFHWLHTVLQIKSCSTYLLAVLIAVGIGGLNEIMEFLISLNLANGVGGYNNTMLDMIFNLAGAIVAIGFYAILKRRR